MAGLEEQLSEEYLEQIMMGVAIAGTAKSLGKEAVALAIKGDFDGARKLAAEAHQQFTEVHGAHFDMISKEARGERVDVCLLLVHMEDHVMTTALYLESVEEQIALLERVAKLEAAVFQK